MTPAPHTPIEACWIKPGDDISTIPPWAYYLAPRFGDASEWFAGMWQRITDKTTHQMVVRLQNGQRIIVKHRPTDAALVALYHQVRDSLIDRPHNVGPAPEATYEALRKLDAEITRRGIKP